MNEMIAKTFIIKGREFSENLIHQELLIVFN